LPVPVSPRISTGRSIGATRVIIEKSACIGALRPIIPQKDGSSLDGIRASSGGLAGAGPETMAPSRTRESLVRAGAGRYTTGIRPLAAMPWIK